MFHFHDLFIFKNIVFLLILRPNWNRKHNVLCINLEQTGNGVVTISQPHRNELRQIDGREKWRQWKLLMERTWTYMWKPHAAIKKHVKRKSAGWENTTTATTSEKWQWFPCSTLISARPVPHMLTADWSGHPAISRCPTQESFLALAAHCKQGILSGSPSSSFPRVTSWLAWRLCSDSPLFKMSLSYKYFSENIQHLIL